MAYQPLNILSDAKEYLDCMVSDGIGTEEFLRCIMPESTQDMSEFLKKNTKTADMVRSILLKNKTSREKANNMLLAMGNMYGWMQNKQVYRPDKDFLELLLQTPLMSFNYKSLRNMPYKNIYVEISSASQIIHGAFVYISEIQNVSVIDIILVSHDNEKQHTHYLIDHAKSEYQIRQVNGNQNNTEIMMIWQTFLYLCSENANVEKNAETEKTYRPGRVIKNRFSEIRKWDVGVRIGSNIRRYKKAVEQDNEKQKSEKTGNPRKRPRPHMRKAHWHRYMTGKGRTVPVIKWIEPVFILSHDCKDMPVTIHPMK